MSLLYSVKSIFRALFVEAPLTDLSFGLFRRRKLPALLRRGRWAELEQVLLSAAPDELSVLLDELCLAGRYAPQLAAYLQASTTEVRRLVAGVCHTRVAWEKRSSCQAAALTQSQVDGFFGYLGQAYHELSQEFSHPGLQLEALGRRIRVEMGWSEKQEAHKSFAAAVSMHPGHTLSYLNYFKLLLPKWLGSEEELRELLDFAADDAQIQQLLRLMYLVEMFTDLYYDDPNVAGRLLQAQYPADIETALAAPRPAADSRAMPDVYINNYLACLYDVLGRRKERQQLIEQLNGRFTVHPWAYFGARGRRQIEILHLS